MEGCRGFPPKGARHSQFWLRSRQLKQDRSALIALSLAVIGASCLTAASVIGVASSRGTMEVNGTAVRGTANVAEGASVKTNETSGNIHLGNGVQVTLGQNSAARVYADRLALTEGAGRVTAAHGYAVEALGFRVDAADRATARVAWDGNRILVTALDSAVQVSQSGVLLARLTPGTTYYFEQDTAKDDTAASAGKVAGNAGDSDSGNGSTANTAKGLSTHAKWGIAAGAAAAAGTGIGLGLYLSGNNASR